MATYRVTLDVTNTRRPEFPSMRVTVDVSAPLAELARQRVRCVYVSADHETVNLTGGVGAGYHYPEWSIVRTRKVATSRPGRVIATSDGRYVTGCR